MKKLGAIKEWPILSVFDIEATEWVNLVLLCHVDERGFRRVFRTMREYLAFLARERIDYVWSHWGGKYDNRFVISELMRQNIEFEIILSGSHAIIVKAFMEKGFSIHFCDSARIMPDSVAKIGKTINLPKLDVDRSNIGALSFAETAEYCYRDCDIVLRGLQEMKRCLSEAGADFAFTLASIATRWVRSTDALDWARFEPEKHGGKDPMDEADEYSEPAYFGGRTECFRVGTFKQKLFYYDVRSSYPWSMTQLLPTYPGKVEDKPQGSARELLSVCGISEASVIVPESHYLPILPSYREQKLLFPVGRFRGRWTNLELLAALDRGVRVKIHSRLVFEETAFMKNFVDTFFGMRAEALQAGDAFKSYAYKILINSAYGKLIESVERSRLIFGSQRVNEAIKRGGEISSTNTIGLYEELTRQKGPFRHVAAGAYVTARSRLLLWDRMDKIIRAGGKVFYCDTDSIVTDMELPEEPDTLGNLKLENVLTEFEAFAPKVYRMITADGKTYYKVKGTPIEKGDDGEKLSDEKAFARWQAYTSGIAIGRVGLSGLKTDIRRGSVDPKAEVLARGLRKQDSKRAHLAGDSTPKRLLG